MADVTGPISTLPGSKHVAPSGAKCDTHEDRDAVARVQGETDSFGSEMHDLCQECYEPFKALDGASFEGSCSCGQINVPLFPVRDWEEGSAGPVYYRCKPCKTAWKLRELEGLDDDPPPVDDYYLLDDEPTAVDDYED